MEPILLTPIGKLETTQGKFFKGAKPTDLPVEQAARELALNLTTAQALGITVPLELLYLANAVHQ